MIESEHHQAALTRIATLEAENARLREAITAALHETDAVVVKIRLRAALKGAPA